MWIARDEDNSLTLYIEKPERRYNTFFPKDDPTEERPIFDSNFACCYIELNEELFPELKWEDEPIEVDLFSYESIQSFGDACYNRGFSDANNFDNGKQKGKLKFNDYVDSKG